jgi:hypothetical protein
MSNLGKTVSVDASLLFGGFTGDNYVSPTTVTLQIYAGGSVPIGQEQYTTGVHDTVDSVGTALAAAVNASAAMEQIGATATYASPLLSFMQQSPLGSLDLTF